VDLLSQTAEGLLLLTATPEQLGLESHFARLRLLDPDRYADFDTFRREEQSQAAIATLVEKLDRGDPLTPQDEKWLAEHLTPKKLQAAQEGDHASRGQLIEDLLDQYGPGRVIFRNTRAAMQGFPKRKPRLAPLSVEAAGQELWVNRLSQEFKADIASAPEQTPPFFFKHDPRVAWLVNLMKELAPAKVLLICRSKEKVLELESALNQRVKFKLGVFHEDLTIVQRDRNAAWFAETDGARLMLCSEIGSEGRNFQFAHHLVLFDLPINPELLEQRIGRLDRIGQMEDIRIHIPYLPGSPQEVLVRWYQEGLQAFGQNLEGGNQIREQFEGELQALALNSPSAERSQA
ncbi:MAG: helicase-related protein, partial [Bacteroidota bacterium]